MPGTGTTNGKCAHLFNPRQILLSPFYTPGTETWRLPQGHEKVGNCGPDSLAGLAHYKPQKHRGRAGQAGKIRAASDVPSTPDSETSALGDSVSPWQRPDESQRAERRGRETGRHGDIHASLAGGGNRPDRLLPIPGRPPTAASELRVGPGRRQPPGRVQSWTAGASTRGPASRACAHFLASGATGAPVFVSALPAPGCLLARRPGRAPCRQLAVSAASRRVETKSRPSLSWVLTASL